jgi:hypothetical protein
MLFERLFICAITPYPNYHRRHQDKQPHNNPDNEGPLEKQAQDCQESPPADDGQVSIFDFHESPEI